MNKKEIEEGDIKFFNFFTDEIFNGDIIINWKQEGNIKYTIKNLIKCVVLDRDYDIFSLIDNTYPYMIFKWNDKSMYKALIYVDMRNKENMRYIEDNRLLYKARGNLEFIRFLSKINKMKYIDEAVRWSYEYHIENEKDILYIDKEMLYTSIICYFCMLFRPLYFSKNGYSINEILTLDKLVNYKDYMDEFEVISKNFNYTIKYICCSAVSFEYKYSKSLEEFLEIYKSQYKNNHINNYYEIDINYNDNNKMINKKTRKIKIIDNLTEYNSLILMLYKII